MEKKSEIDDKFVGRGRECRGGKRFRGLFQSTASSPSTTQKNWGRGRDIRLECKVVVQVLGHGGIAKRKGGFGEDFRWMILGGKGKGGGV